MNTPGREQVEAQVAKILASRTFHNAERLSRFLQYVTDQAAAGAAAEVKEYSIGVEVFQRGPGFDPRSDSVVRVEARRLRAKLRDYYETEGVSDPVVLSIPKGGYVPEFRQATVKPGPGGPGRWAWLSLAGAAVVLLALLFGWPRIGAVFGKVRPGVAVLPLNNLSSDAVNEHFCHALANEVASQLGHDGRIRVVTRGPDGPLSARTDLKKLSDSLTIGTAFEGSASFSGGRVRVTLMLVDLKQYSNRWLETYDRELGDPLAVQRELGAVIAGEVRKHL